MSVPTAAGTRRVAGVSRRRPRSGPVRVRVGGWLDVITPPSSHMCGGREAAPRGGGGASAVGHGLAGRGRAERVCVCARLPEMRRGAPTPYSCGARRTGMPRAPNSAATSGLRADRRIRFGVLCRIRAAMAGSTRRRRGIWDVSAELARNPHGPCYRFPSSCRRPGAPGETATTPAGGAPAPGETATTPARGAPAPGETATTPAGGTPTSGETKTTPVARQGPLLCRFG